MRIGRECAEQMKIQPVRRRGQQRRASRRLVNMVLMMMWMSCLLFLIIELWVVILFKHYILFLRCTI